MKKIRIILFILILANCSSFAQNQNFWFGMEANGLRVCLSEAEVDLNKPSVTIKLVDYVYNNAYPTYIYRRKLYGTGADWKLVASELPAGTSNWVDTDVALGEVWEYKVKRLQTWSYLGVTYDATGYTIGSLEKDNSNYQGQMILLVADNIVKELSTKYERLKKELTGDGWYVNEIVVPKAKGWYSGDTVVTIRNQINTVYTNAPANDKPKALFILGHVPMPRSGLTYQAPDGHSQNKGARGFDGYYADIDGKYTDVSTFDPGDLATPLAINIPGDYKWDQDFFASNIEMAFGRVDFADIIDYNDAEISLIERYLDKLSNYKNVASGFEMGEKSAFCYGFNNSNDGSYRSLPSISKSINVYQNSTENIFPKWVKENGPFKIFMQNQYLPDIPQWNDYGMNATVYSSDQSLWGYNDVPEDLATYSKIRALLASNTKCLVALWTTTPISTFYQACTGDPFGFAIKEIMNHNPVNNNIEKPQQSYDHDWFWNRTFLSYNGDPTISLFQVKPPSNLDIQQNNGEATLTWSASADSNIIGYHIYKSTSEFGKYNRITSIPVTKTSFVDATYEQNDWYMVRAIKNMESGCGQFMQPSMGIFIQGSFAKSVKESELVNTKIFPNPTNDKLIISSAEKIISIKILNIDGKIVHQLTSLNLNIVQLDISSFTAGTYLLELETSEAVRTKKIIIK